MAEGYWIWGRTEKDLGLSNQSSMFLLVITDASLVLNRIVQLILSSVYEGFST